MSSIRPPIPSHSGIICGCEDCNPAPCEVNEEFNFGFIGRPLVDYISRVYGIPLDVVIGVLGAKLRQLTIGFQLAAVDRSTGSPGVEVFTKMMIESVASNLSVHIRNGIFARSRPSAKDVLMSYSSNEEWVVFNTFRTLRELRYAEVPMATWKRVLCAIDVELKITAIKLRLIIYLLRSSFYLRRTGLEQLASLQSELHLLG
ncbi:hypothetical protein BJ875DRAFT_443981 [Amylocarpus encephaloides]|uniref:Uncharacterized protein n=1 Tax=Amylocarpus encephaloides TaxID=45428 RepID=A0A9P7YEI9_9HELO|nr:hypothetical protein BJ875DRAFT_443981 [Amylocarpus encephaloides]